MGRGLATLTVLAALALAPATALLGSARKAFLTVDLLGKRGKKYTGRYFRFYITR